MSKNKSILAATLVIAAMFSSCSEVKESEASQVYEETVGIVEKAVANVKGTDGNDVTGIVTFEKVDGGVRITADIKGLKPGKHGFHIHEKGDCGGDKAANAGSHFNPTNKNHGAPDSNERHVGDLGNLVADEEGHAKLDTVDKVISLEGKDTIVGKSVIIHENEDDFVTQPTGNAGGRVACGVITAENQ